MSRPGAAAATAAAAAGTFWEKEGRTISAASQLCIFPLHLEDAFSGSTVNTTPAEVEVEASSAEAHHIPPPPEGVDSERGDGVVRPRQGWLNKSRSEDRATGHDNEVVLGH